MRYGREGEVKKGSSEGSGNFSRASDRAFSPVANCFSARRSRWGVVSDGGGGGIPNSHHNRLLTCENLGI